MASPDPVRGDAVRAAEDGAWCCMAGIDLAGVAEVTVDGDGAPVSLRVDDPYAREDLAVVPPGVHDRYLVMNAGTRVTTITFRA